MFQCNIIRWVAILLVAKLFFFIVTIDAKTTPAVSKYKTMLPLDNLSLSVSQTRFNRLAIGGSINYLFSLINLILGLVNFYFIFGKYRTRLRQTTGKLEAASTEMSKREMHPKIKMTLSRVFQPEGVPLETLLPLLKEPSPLFDGSNGLLDGQKEARLRNLKAKEKEGDEKKKKNKSKSPSPASTNDTGGSSAMQSTLSEVKKTK
ncbi:unnamed protein product [Caenorhabditis sp. 36 PRJEB53466]|nr:unnamed protein product [Caenorhabditis sp. 36 PRJEB53466]